MRAADRICASLQIEILRHLFDLSLRAGYRLRKRFNQSRVNRIFITGESRAFPRMQNIVAQLAQSAFQPGEHDGHPPPLRFVQRKF